MKTSLFWCRIGAGLQLITALLHGSSLFIDSPPANQTEKQMIDLMQTYQMDMGAGFHRTFEQIFISISAFMTLSLLFAAAVNFVISRSELPRATRNRFMLINFIYSTLAAIVFYFWAFLPPFLCLALIALAFAIGLMLERNVHQSN